MLTTPSPPLHPLANLASWRHLYLYTKNFNTSARQKKKITRVNNYYRYTTSQPNYGTTIKHVTDTPNCACLPACQPMLGWLIPTAMRYCWGSSLLPSLFSFSLSPSLSLSLSSSLSMLHALKPKGNLIYLNQILPSSDSMHRGKNSARISIGKHIAYIQQGYKF